MTRSPIVRVLLLAAVAAAVVLGLRLLPGEAATPYDVAETTTSAPVTPPSTTAAAPTSTTVAPAPAARPATTTATATVEPWQVTARAFIRTYLSGPTTPAATWHKRITPWCTPELAAGFERTDPTLIPAATVTAAEVASRSDLTGEGVMRFTLSTGDRIDVYVTETPGGTAHLVSDVRPVR